MKLLRANWLPLLLALLFFAAFVFFPHTQNLVKSAAPPELPFDEEALWTPPSPDAIPANEKGDLIRYGRELITHTSVYLGPKGLVSARTNGMNCQNCHLDAGTRNFALPLSAVAANFPKWLERSQRTQSVEDRVNDCLQRSLNGKPLDSSNYEMRAIVAYLQWVGSQVPQKVKPRGSGIHPLPFLDRAADPQKGQRIYTQHCSRCHGDDGQGMLLVDKTAYTYPPLWGPHSYNVNATLYRLIPLASFISASMPFDKPLPAPALSNEDAWDVAAYISAQPRPGQPYAADWPRLQTKPIDHPYPPYADPFPAQAHKFGPFPPIVRSLSAGKRGE